MLPFDDEPEELDDAFLGALHELEHYLDAIPHEHVAAFILPCATRWILTDVGLDLVRLREEAQTHVEETPSWERSHSGYVEQVGSWVSQRMLVGTSEDEDLDDARRHLACARYEIARRAETIEAAGFSRVADGFRLPLEETAAGDPPADALWRALAARIAESVMP